METINDARICVNTQKRLAQKLPRGKWFPLSDYADRNEFLTACYAYYRRDNSLELRFTGWEHIPEELITTKSISENFFLLREAMEALDENEYAYFLKWCRTRGYRLAEEEPYQLVTRYKEVIPDVSLEDELPLTRQKTYDLSDFSDEEEDYHRPTTAFDAYMWDRKTQCITHKASFLYYKQKHKTAHPKE